MDGYRTRRCWRSWTPSGWKRTKKERQGYSMRKLRVLLACEMSGRVAFEFAKQGWEAWSADILPGEMSSMYANNGGVYRHYQGDVRDLFDWYHPVNRKRRSE